MSKAFTSEETEDTSVAGRPPLRAPRGQERPITREGHQALVDALTRLEQERSAARAVVTDHERDAALRALDARIAVAQATLDSVRVISAPEVADGVARFGSEVTLTWNDGRRQTVRLVGPDEADVKKGFVSIDSPLARALLDARAGSVIEVELPRGPQTAVVDAVR